MILTRARVSEIAGSIVRGRGGEFSCHKTVDYELVDHEGNDDTYAQMNTAKKHCAGALIFAEKKNAPTQMMRICERIGLYNAKALMSNLENVAQVFDTYEEMLEHLTRNEKPVRKSKLVKTTE